MGLSSGVFVTFSLALFCIKVESTGSCSNGFAGDNSESLANGANDIIVVRQSNGSFSATPIQVQIGKLANWRTMIKSREGRPVKIYVNNFRAETSAPLTISDSGNACFDRRQDRHHFSSDEIANLHLVPGKNRGLFVVNSLSIEIVFNIYMYEQNTKLVLTDIDGTITESDFKGHVYPVLGVNADHDNVVELFHKIGNNGYQMVYLTARSMAQDSDTRDYLFQDLQNQDGYSLPQGPVFMSPKTFAQALVDAMTDPSIVKTDALVNILRLFDVRQDAIVGAYGNRNSDTEAYMGAGIRPNIIYMINNEGELLRASDGRLTSYNEHAQNVDQYYPKLPRQR